MLGFLLGYGVARSVSRSRARRAALLPGYAEFEFIVLTGALLVGAAWPVHLGFALRRWGLAPGWAIGVATLAVGLATGSGYLVIGFLYGAVWLAVLIARGVDAEKHAEEGTGPKA